MQDNQQDTQPVGSQETPKENNIFIANPEPPKEQQKKTIAREVIAAIIFVIIIIVSVVAWSFLSANTAVNQYNSATKKQLAALEAPLKDLTPDLVINNKNLDTTLEKIIELQQPNLRIVFFASALSPMYRQAEATQKQVNEYYKELNQYAQDVTKLVSFSAQVKEIQTQLTEAKATTQMNNPASLRVLGGTVTKYQQQLVTMNAPPQLKDIQRQIAEAYAQEVEDYYAWATAIDENQPAKAQELEANITKNTLKIDEMTTDENYVKQFNASYRVLQQQQQAITQRLNS